MESWRNPAINLPRIRNIMSDLPKDFADALKAAGLTDFFANCTNSHRREYLKWVSEAKRPETRSKRIAKAMKMIANRRAEENARAKKKA